MAPSPSTAVPLVSTATRFCRDGEIGGLFRIGGDRLAGEGDAGGIGEREVALIGERLGRGDFEFAGTRLAMKVQGVGFEVGDGLARHGWLSRSSRLMRRMGRAGKGKARLSSEARLGLNGQYATSPALFNDLVGAAKQCDWEAEAQCFGSLEVDD